MNTFIFKIKRLSKGFVFKISAWALIGMFVPLLGGLNISGKILLSQNSLTPEPILNILATSLLTVTTFSLGIIVSTYSAVANQTSPRATILITHNPTIQYVLSTFIGAFLYSLVGMIALYSHFYTPAGKVLVLLITVIVVICVIIAFIRWINYLFIFGRIPYIIEELAEVALNALIARKSCRAMGARLGSATPPCFPSSHHLYANQTGFIQYIDIHGLNQWAEKKRCHIYVCVEIGNWVNLSHRLTCVTQTLTDQDKQTIMAFFLIRSGRVFDNDPYYGCEVLNEVAMKALSPGINDPGTAKSVISQLIRVLSEWSDNNHPEKTAYYPCVSMPMLEDETLFGVCFDSLLPLMVSDVRLQTFFVQGILSLEQINPSCWQSVVRKRLRILLSMLPQGAHTIELQQLVRDAFYNDVPS
ncbi:DUF2254 family protein [Providencia stuartii]|uniref:DUF2254 family protein n=1 Tax=Providencia stuartii TaxID=588 RepID=UPI001122EB02|nr:DUF2254 family protein [Providencia stuartii]